MRFYVINYQSFLLLYDLNRIKKSPYTEYNRKKIIKLVLFYLLNYNIYRERVYKSIVL